MRTLKDISHRLKEYDWGAHKILFNDYPINVLRNRSKEYLINIIKAFQTTIRHEKLEDKEYEKDI